MEFLDDISHFLTSAAGPSDADFFSTDKAVVHSDSQDETLQTYREQAKDRAANPPQFDFYEQMDRSQYDPGYAQPYAD
jgi:hypothetical protein